MTVYTEVSGVGDSWLPVSGKNAHEQRVEFLDTLAVLMGCEGALCGALPDGRRPDVLRYDLEHKFLFLGDAKHSETPHNKETQARLQRYMKWMASHISGGGRGVFAICFGRGADAHAWTVALRLLSQETGIEHSKRGIERFEPGLTVVWSEFMLA